MRRVVFLAGLTLALGVLVPGSGLADVGGSDLPVKGTVSGYGTMNLLTGQFHIDVTGPVSHFGLTTFEQDAQLVPTGPTTFDWFGTWTATAANGDQMSGASSGTGSIPDGIHGTSLGQYVSTGGTGRFGDATLTYDVVVHGTRFLVEGPIATSSYEATLVGTLSY